MLDHDALFDLPRLPAPKQLAHRRTPRTRVVHVLDDDDDNSPSSHIVVHTHTIQHRVALLPAACEVTTLVQYYYYRLVPVSASMSHAATQHLVYPQTTAYTRDTRYQVLQVWYPLAFRFDGTTDHEATVRRIN